MAQPTLLLTRPRAQSERFLADLDENALRRVQVLIAPLMEIEGTGATVDADAFSGVIFTSANGVAFAPEGQGHPAYCVGEMTTRKAAARGWDALECGETAQELVSDLVARRPAGPLLHLAGAHTRGDIAEQLSQAGLPTTRLTLYRQNLLPLEAKARKVLQSLAIVPLFSPRSAAQFVLEVGNLASQAHVVALSPAVAEPLRDVKPASLLVLAAPQGVLMRKAVQNLCLRLGPS